MKNFILSALFFIISHLILAQSIRYVNSTTLNVRSGPSTAYSIQEKLKRGTEVQVISQNKGWGFITTPHNSTGYVSLSLLSTQSHSSAFRQIPPTSRAYKREANVYICNSKSSYAYHSHFCHGLNRCRSGFSKVTLSEAIDYGYQACKICY